MTAPADPRWEHVQDIAYQGGQGRSYMARDRSNGSFVFIKEPKQNKAIARKRFRREVAAYETVQHAGLPRLIYDNSAEWANSQVRLLLVLEWVDGVTLRHKIGRYGSQPLSDTAACVKELGAVLAECHKVGVTHRDVKPANVILRDGFMERPVLVDFGLSFNESDEQDVTRAEEIGNRFLRLPEHAAEGNSRSHLSDITQLAGLHLYCLTGMEPRVLWDEEGKAPHQRQRIGPQLASALDTIQLRRLLSVYDRAFDPRLAARFQSIEELMQELDTVMQHPSADDSDPTVRFHEFVTSPASQRAAEDHAVLSQVTARIHGAVYRLATSHGLQSDQTAHRIVTSEPVSFGETAMRTWPAGGLHDHIPRVTFRVELRGSELVALADSEPIWRGLAVNESFDQAVERAIKVSFLRSVDASAPKMG